MMLFVQPLHQNLSSRLPVSSLLIKKRKTMNFVNWKGWSCNNCDLYHELDVVCACTWIYICHTQVPIGLCQNNIILLFLGRSGVRCAAAFMQVLNIEVNIVCSSISSTCSHSALIILAFLYSVYILLLSSDIRSLSCISWWPWTPYTQKVLWS